MLFIRPSKRTARERYMHPSEPAVCYWLLQNATRDDLNCGIFTSVHAQALFEHAFGSDFTTQCGVRYTYDSVWKAQFHLLNNPLTWVELCYNAPNTWRISRSELVDSIAFAHSDDQQTLMSNLMEYALIRLMDTHCSIQLS